MLGNIAFLRRCAAVMGNDQLALLEEFVRYSDAFTQQPAWISTQIENQTLQIAEFIERFRNFLFGCLVESADVHVADAWPNQEVNVHAVARNLVAHQREFHGFFYALTRNADMDGCTLGTFQQVGNIARAHVLGRLTIDRDDYVSGMNTRLVGRRSGEGEDHDNFVIARPDGHAHAVVLAALILAHQCIGFGIEEIRVGIERVQHSRDSAVVDRLIRVNRLGIVLFDDGVNIGELFEAVLNLRVAGERSRLLASALSKQNAQKSAGEQEKNYQKK